MGRLRRILLIAVAPAMGAAVVVMPAIAGSETGLATITAENEGIYGHKWNPRAVAVGEGATVTISNPTEVPHGVHWTSATTPVCSGTVPVGTSESASGAHWSGTCTFTTPGTYTFYCTVHGPSMSGSITVGSPGTPPGTTPAPTNPAPGPGTTLTATEPTPLLSGSPLLGSASSAVKLAVAQRGSSVHGSVRVAAAGAGGRLQVDVFANGVSLAHRGFSRRARGRVGRFVRSSLAAGTVTFAVPLSAVARRALRHGARLTLTVALTLTPPAGAAITVTRHVTLRR